MSLTECQIGGTRQSRWFNKKMAERSQTLSLSLSLSLSYAAARPRRGPPQPRARAHV
jgi:hypothetical protein